jgi:hypothetical protein
MMGIFNKAWDFEKKLEAKKQRSEEKERQKLAKEATEDEEFDAPELTEY